MNVDEGASILSLAEMLEAANDGDQYAWEAIVARFERLVWATARAHRLAQPDAADVFQTTWLRLVENLDRIRDPEHLGSWLVTTARRECLRVIRLRSRELATDSDGTFDLSRDDPVSRQVIIEARDGALLRALSAIDERCQMLLRILSAVDPPSYEEIGAALDMPIGAIGPTRARCLQKLRRRPELIGYDPREPVA
jgi:RNA polymerase sigma factor (sigma-70 family)